jgi:hypothetical protein
MMDGLGVFFVVSNLAAGARVPMLSHGVAPRYADRFLIGGATAVGLPLIPSRMFPGRRHSFSKRSAPQARRGWFAVAAAFSRVPA